MPPAPHLRALLALLLCGATALQPAADPGPAPWRLVWRDEFDAKELDRTKWACDLGNGFFAGPAKVWIPGWGNDELQYYTAEPANVAVQDGVLRLRALKESVKGCAYTSARLTTRGADGKARFAQRYGRFEVRAKLPLGRGLWPAIWLLPLDERYGGWAASGELDLMEAKGHEPTAVHGTLHFGATWPANVSAGKPCQLPRSGRISDFHVYALEWEPGVVRWYVDDALWQTQNFWWSSSKMTDGKGVPPAGEADLNVWPAPFDQPFYLLLNLAVGGRFAGDPDATTPFPAEMQVDYVRVYERAGGYDPPAPRGPGKLPWAARQ